MVLADSIFIDVSDLEALYSYLDELDSVCRVVDDTFDEENDDYNDTLEHFEDESEDFLVEIENILSALKAESSFASKWKKSKVNLEIDNT